MLNNLSKQMIRKKNVLIPRIVINGKTLQPSTSRSGVHRVAHETLLALDKLLFDNPALADAVACRVIVPGGNAPQILFSRIKVEVTDQSRKRGPLMRKLSGVFWEQLLLPLHARGETLINLCNIGPVMYRNAFTIIHDAQVYISPNSYSRAFRTWYRFVLPLLGKRNRALLTGSQYSREKLDQFGVAAAARIRVNHLGADHVLRLVPDFEKVCSAGLNDKKYVVALANIQLHKNIAVLLKAFALPALQNVMLVLFGGANREDFERQGHVVPQNVKFLGFVTDEQLAGLLQHAIALGFPSTTEGFGLPPLEAMALGCPAVIAPCGSLVEVCADAALWADPNDASQWAQQIVRLCEDQSLRSEMQSRGRARAAHFTWEKAVHRLLETVIGKPLAETGLMGGAQRGERVFESTPASAEHPRVTQPLSSL